MPNTLVHLGVQGAASRALFSHGDLKWIFLGCILPDVPWILRRGVSHLGLEIDAIQLKLYAGAQASLTLTLLLCGALALITTRPGRVFAVLAFNAILHLLVDALETKWANGVHFFAPVDWELWNARLGIWPESPLILGLTLFGLAFFLWTWWRAPPQASGWSRKPVRHAAAIFLLGAYLALPWILRSGPAAADSYYLATLQSREERAGRYIEFDRNLFLAGEDPRILADNGDTLRVIGNTPERTGGVSLRGRFVSPDTVLAYASHSHDGRFRDGASYLGLGLLAVYWASSFFGAEVRRRRYPASPLTDSGTSASETRDVGLSGPGPSRARPGRPRKRPERPRVTPTSSGRSRGPEKPD